MPRSDWLANRSCDPISGFLNPSALLGRFSLSPPFILPSFIQASLSHRDSHHTCMLTHFATLSGLPVNRLARPLIGTPRPALPPTASAHRSSLYVPSARAHTRPDPDEPRSSAHPTGSARPAARSRCITSPSMSDSRSGPAPPPT